MERGKGVWEEQLRSLSARGSGMTESRAGRTRKRCLLQKPPINGISRLGYEERLIPKEQKFGDPRWVPRTVNLRGDARRVP